MTKLGTFWEGVILILLGIGMAVVGKVFAMDFSTYTAQMIPLGVGYIAGGAAPNAIPNGGKAI
jgi:hypothetical protein